MNGVRRLLGATSSSSSSPPPPPPPHDPPVPLAVKSGPSWPPQSPSTKPLALGDSIQSTAALFLGKKDKPRQQPEDEVVTIGSPYTATRPLNASSSSNPTTSSPSQSTPSSPINRVARKSVNKSEAKRSSGLNARDDMFMSLLASDAVVDCRDFDVLTQEEVEELKKEQQVLNSRLIAMKKKLVLETKIRDAALSLSKVNASHKKVSKQTEEQLDAANRRVDSAQKELWSISERVNEVHRKLMEHRAGVLSYSVRKMEKRQSVEGNGSGSVAGSSVGSAYDSGYDSNRSTMTVQSTNKFDGAHFFAGHANAIIPTSSISTSQDLASTKSQVVTLESKVKELMESLTTASKKQADLTRELSLVKLEKQEVETMLGLELQTAEDTILALEKDLPRLENLDTEVQELLEEKDQWEIERKELEEKCMHMEDLERKIEVLERMNGENAGMNKVLGEVREESRIKLEGKERELDEMRRMIEVERLEWEKTRGELESSKGGDMQQMQEEMQRIRSESQTQLQAVYDELDNGLAALGQMVKEHGIVLFSRDTSLKGLLEAVSSHLQTVHSKLEGYARAEADWSDAKRKLEDDIRLGLDKRETLTKELEEARRERDFAQRESRILKDQTSSAAASQTSGSARSSPNIQSRSIPPISTSLSSPSSSAIPLTETGDMDVNRIYSILHSLWAILPSPETRAAKFAGSTRGLRIGSSSSSASPNPNHSLSDLDVRSLKSLYSTNPNPSTPTRNSNSSAPNSPHTPTAPNTHNNNVSVSLSTTVYNLTTGSSGQGNFTVESFVQRVQALINDDRALIERLIRFAQAHDLLKKNAERAQKLAQDGNVAMETYQKQVRIMEERNMGLVSRLSVLQEEIQNLNTTIEHLTSSKIQIESLAAEQAETLHQLTQANNSLSARTLSLAEEASNVPEKLKKQYEFQISELKIKLEKAEDEIEAMRSLEQNQRIALLDELNSMQTENGNLRAQIRAQQRK